MAAANREWLNMLKRVMRLGLAVDRAVLVVAHRTSAIERAGRVVMIERGSVVEHGTHAELLAAGGRYAAMHRTGGSG